MIFTSYTYVVFLACAFTLYWTIPARHRLSLAIALSYLFYCSWSFKFGFLLLGLSLFNWAYGRYVLARSKEARGLTFGILINLAPLLYFKYTLFLLSNLVALVHLAGIHWTPLLPERYLPLGISFFTFQGIAYLVDVGTGEPPFESLRDFLFYKAFWPQLIAGPIIRPGEIREQIETERTLDYSDLAFGLRRIAQGAFKKVVLADTLAPLVDSVFLPGSHPAFVDAVAAAAGFGLQIYFDFSAYSDISIGTARLFGFRFPENFDWPYQARSPQEFWNRWHMTLSRWIRDYVFTPLSFAFRGSRWGKATLVAAMAVCGLWHGAQWTFVLWGVWHGVLLLLNQTLLMPLFAPSRKNDTGTRLKSTVALLVTLGAVLLGWIFFRANDLAQARELFHAILGFRGGLRPSVLRENAILIIGAFWLGVFGAWLLRGLPRQLGLTAHSGAAGEVWRWAIAVGYTLITTAVIVFQGDAKAFVYFQF
jgi:alginate O-acetyltransferase complex protein AlgI